MDVGDINIVTGLLKLLLRILPDPVIPFSYYDAFIEAMGTFCEASNNVFIF